MRCFGLVHFRRQRTFGYESSMTSAQLHTRAMAKLKKNQEVQEKVNTLHLQKFGVLTVRHADLCIFHWDESNLHCATDHFYPKAVVKIPAQLTVTMLRCGSAATMQMSYLVQDNSLTNSNGLRGLLRCDSSWYLLVPFWWRVEVVVTSCWVWGWWDAPVEVGVRAVRWRSGDGFCCVRMRLLACCDGWAGGSGTGVVNCWC